jgi:hypothetical protein
LEFWQRPRLVKKSIVKTARKDMVFEF